MKEKQKGKVKVYAFTFITAFVLALGYASFFTFLKS